MLSTENLTRQPAKDTSIIHMHWANKVAKPKQMYTLTHTRTQKRDTSTVSLVKYTYNLYGMQNLSSIRFPNRPTD